jgi:hypothetical protein
MIINDLYNNKKTAVAEDIGDLGYNVVRYYEKTQEVKKLTNWLEKEAGLPRNSPLYFDDVDLVYGNKTIVPSALINPKLTFNDLLTAVVQASKQGMSEATGDEKFDTMMGQIQREPKYPDSQMPPTDVKDLYQWAVKNNKPYHKIFAEWANREGYKSVAPALQRAGDLDTEALDYWTPRVWEIYWGEVRGIDSEMPPEWAKKRIPDELRDYLDTVFDAYDRIVFDWPTEYRQIGQQGMAEGKADYNFDIEDLKRLEQIRDLATLKAQALELISKPSAKPMKPEKVEWFRNALERMNSPLKVIKLMYDLLLSGEGKAVVGTRSSTNPNTYRQRFGEQGMAENMADDMAAMAQKKFPTAYISKDGKEVQKPENWGKRYTPPAAAPADLEKQRRDLTAKYPNIDELVRRAELNRDPDYEMADGEAYYAARDAEQNYQKLRQIQRVIQGLNEHKERQNNMRTKEITESQLDEISLDQIGTGIANVIGGVSKAAGAVAGVPQGIGRAVKKGYRGAVKGIGGAADDGSNPQSDVPGAAYGDTSQGKELPTGTGEINPATGRAYVPSDFGNQADDIAAGGAENSPAAIQQQIRTVERNYQTQMADLTAKLKAVQGQGGASGPALSKQQQDYIASIGTDEPSAGSTAIAPTASTAPMAPDRSYEVNPTAPSMARDPKVLNTLQAMNAKELQIIKKILQARARATNESELSEVAFGDVWRGTGDRLKNATSGIRSAASGAASAVKGAAASAADMAKSAYKTAKPYVKKAGKFAASVPGAVATGAGAVAGGVAGMKNAARKGYAAGQKHVGGGALTMDELQQAIGGMTADDAKQLLTFIKQLEIQNAPAKSKAKSKAKTSTTTPTTTTTTTPTWTGRQKDLATVAESLTWSRSFDPGMIVYKRMKSGR